MCHESIDFKAIFLVFLRNRTIGDRFSIVDTHLNLWSHELNFFESYSREVSVRLFHLILALCIFLLLLLS